MNINVLKHKNFMVRELSQASSFALPVEFQILLKGAL